MAKRENNHTQYIVNGIEYPSVTTVLKMLSKENLVYWANYLGFKRLKVDDVLNDAADIGTYVHYLCQCKIMSYEYMAYNVKDRLMIESVNRRYKQFLDFYDQHTITPIFCEKKFASEKYGFGGTLDFFGELDGIPTLMDFKTSKAFYVTMFIQLAGYNILLRENNFLADEVAVLLIHEDKHKILVKPQIDLPKYEDAFLKLLEMYRCMEVIGWETIKA